MEISRAVPRGTSVVAGPRVSTSTPPGSRNGAASLPAAPAPATARIVVDAPQPGDWFAKASDGDLPEAALRAFPAIEAIMRDEMVRRT